ncbi:MAG: hypothetical protein ABI697_01740 [Devosia sp.]
MRYVLIVLALLCAPLLMATSAVAQGYPLMCHAGGGMAFHNSGDGSTVISFKRASQGFGVQPPDEGQCAWNDRPTNSAEPRQIRVIDPIILPRLMARIERGGFFTINAYTNGDALEVASGDFDDHQPSTEPAAQIPSEAGQMPSNEPMPQAMSSTFSGQWESQTEDGNEFAIELKQNGKIVNGHYEGIDNDVEGSIKGVIKDGALHFTWKQGKYRGSGEFTLSDDGESFEGSFTVDGQHGEKAWSGNRL